MGTISVRSTYTLDTETAQLIRQLAASWGVSQAVALRYEIDHNPHPMRKAFAQETLSKSASAIPASSAAEQRAREYMAMGIKALDALHLACAVEGGADYFCTCDDRLLRRAKQSATGSTRAVSPLELIEILDP